MKDVKEFLLEQRQNWAIYRVDGPNKKYFCDSYYGPMWKQFPDEVNVPPDLKLMSMSAVYEYLNKRRG